MHTNKQACLLALLLLFTGCAGNEQKAEGSVADAGSAEAVSVVRLEDIKEEIPQNWPEEENTLTGVGEEDADLSTMEGYNHLLWNYLPNRNYVRVCLKNSTQLFTGDFVFPPDEEREKAVFLHFEVDLNEEKVLSVSQTNQEKEEISEFAVEDKGLIDIAKKFSKVLRIKFEK